MEKNEVDYIIVKLDILLYNWFDWLSIKCITFALVYYFVMWTHEGLFYIFVILSNCVQMSYVVYVVLFCNARRRVVFHKNASIAISDLSYSLH